MFQVVKQDEAGLQFSPQHGIDRVDRYIDGLVGFLGRGESSRKRVPGELVGARLSQSSGVPGSLLGSFVCHASLSKRSCRRAV